MTPPPAASEGTGSPGGPRRLLVLAAVFGGVFLLGLSPVSDGDIFWHLAAGREMVRRHDWLRVDTFTVSAFGRPWPDVHWLFQLAAYGIHQASGLGGLVVAKAALLAVGAVMLVRTVDRVAGPIALAVCAIGLLAALFLARHALLLRPVVVTLVMLALFFSTLESCRVGRVRWLIVLPLAQIVWANCQGLSALGPALIAAYLIAALASPRTPRRYWPFASEAQLPTRALALTFALCAAALFATPYGVHGAALPGRLFLRLAPVQSNVFSAQVAENVPPLVLQRTAPEEVARFPWYLAAVAVCLVAARRRLSLSRLLVLLGFGGLALMANRNVLLFYWVATPMCALLVAPASPRQRPLMAWLPSRWSSRAPLLAHLALAAILAGELALAGAAHAVESPVNQPTPFHFPVTAARYLKGAGAAGRVFAPDHHGGYLTFMVPAIVPYIDTRLTLHTGEEYADYLRAIDQPLLFDALDDAVHFRYVVLTTSYPDRYLALAQHLAAHLGWRLIHTDGSELLFARQGVPLDLGQRATTSAILRELAVRFGDAPAVHHAARFHFARLLIVLERTDEAQFVLATLGDDAAAVQLRARAHFVAGEVAAAEALSRMLLDANGDDVKSLALLARIAFAGGDVGGGVGWLRRALEVDPRDSEALGLLAQAEANAPQATPAAGLKAPGS